MSVKLACKECSVILTLTEHPDHEVYCRTDLRENGVLCPHCNNTGMGQDGDTLIADHGRWPEVSYVCGKCEVHFQALTMLNYRCVG
jgi:hypothetical protein